MVSERTICRFWNLLFLFPNFSFAASAAVHRIWQNGAETNWHKTLPKASVSGIFITSDRNSPHINKFNVNLFSLIHYQNIQSFHVEVRDWHYPHDAAFGGEGGELVLQRLLAADEDQPLEVGNFN